MTVPVTLRAVPHRTSGRFSRPKTSEITALIEKFKTDYEKETSSASKSAYLNKLFEILDRFSIKKWKIEQLTQLAQLYLLLQVKDRRSLITNLPEKFKTKSFPKLSISGEFPPLLLLTDNCCLNRSIHRSDNLLIENWEMPELYRTTFNALKGEDKVRFNARLMGETTIHEPPACDYTMLNFDRTGIEARTGIYGFFAPPFSAAITSNHHYVTSSESLRSDPIADDCIFFKGDDCLFTSLTDGGGHGDAVVQAAVFANQYFMRYLFELKELNLSPAETLKRALFSSAALFQLKDIKEAATHSGLFARNNPLSGEKEVAVSLLGDTGAYLLIERKDASLLIEKLLPISYNKATSSNAGCISSHSDFGNLRLCQFTLPEGVEKAFIIQGSDGVWDNFDPRNALKPDLSEAISHIMQNPEQFYKNAKLRLEIEEISLSEIFLNAKDQKNASIYNETHLFTNPNSLQLLLNNHSSFKPCQKSWKNADLEALIPAYEKLLIENIYHNSAPGTFASNLVEHAKKQGKPDDILALVTRIV